jgi:archaeosine synthase alpha-subunit
MLEVQARDGAGRTARLSLGPRTLELPTLFWLPDALPPGDADWEPLLTANHSARATLVATTRFTQPPSPAGEGQLVLQRRLQPTASMLGDRVLVQGVGDHVAAWGAAYDLFKDPKRFVPALTRARDEAGFARALYAPGLGAPAHLAVLVYAGIDLFDAVPLHLAAARGEYLTAHGAFDATTLDAPECACPACRAEPPSAFTQAELASHNQWAARTELGVVRNALRAGRLRELVEGRIRAHPELTGLLRRVDEAPGLVEPRAAVARNAALWASSKESLQRAECRRFRERVHDRYRPPTAPPVLLLLPCSHRKPYSKSRTHRAFADALWAAGAAGLVHEVILTSPLGLVPRELELTYPAAHYDVPVTGAWDEEEGAMIRDLLARVLAKRRYERVVSHLPRRTYELVRSLLPPDTVVTCEGDNATDPAALRRLELTLRNLSAAHRRAPLPRLQLERLRALSDYQFGPRATDALFAGAEVTGKWPTGKVIAEGVQLAMLPTGRGLLSLTLPGARRLLQAGAYAVEIDDFAVRGTVFAVGVRAADPAIRPGDDVVVHHGGDVRAVGQALMSGREMVELRRGEAVNARHHA